MSSGLHLEYNLENHVFKAAGRAIKSGAGFMLGWGATVGNGSEGWSKGAKFIHVDGGAGLLEYRNTGTNTSATWTLVDVLGTGGAALVGILDSAGHTVKTNVEDAIAEIYKNMFSVQAFLNIPIGSAVEADGTDLLDFVDATGVIPGWAFAAEIVGIRWNNHANPDPVSFGVVIPPDLDASKDAILHFMAAKDGNDASDAVTWTVTAFNAPDAALYDADSDFGGASSAMTANATAKTIQEETLTLVAANMAGSPNIMAITVQPTDGTLATDDVILFGLWLEYTKKLLTA